MNPVQSFQFTSLDNGDRFELRVFFVDGFCEVRVFDRSEVLRGSMSFPRTQTPSGRVQLSFDGRRGAVLYVSSLHGSWRMHNRLDSHQTFSEDFSDTHTQFIRELQTMGLETPTNNFSRAYLPGPSVKSKVPKVKKFKRNLPDWF